MVSDRDRKHVEPRRPSWPAAPYRDIQMQIGRALKEECALPQGLSHQLLTLLVLFGAVLGILLRGKNPLAVFVVGFVPAVLLVLLITAGREVTEGKPEHVGMGIFLIWAGNGVLLLLVAAVYAKLLRR